jgi:hypothetical protein
MKNKLKILVLCLFILSGCKKDFDKIIESDQENNPKLKKTASGGDGRYDVLGYAYDATGLYMDVYSTSYPVVDVGKFLAQEPNNVETTLAPTTTGYYSAGENSEQFAADLTLNANISSDNPLFSLEVKGGYGIENTNSSEFSYANYYWISKLKRIQFNSSVDNLSNYLSDQFIYDLNTKTADWIVLNYGTHVLLSVELGARLQIYYQSITTGNQRKESVTAGMAASVGSIFSVGGDVSYNNSLVSNNTSASLSWSTSGGGAAGLVGSIDLSSPSTPTINISNWTNSIELSNAVLVNVAPGKMIYIYDLITDPTKKLAVKAAVEDYISGNTITYASDIIEFKRTPPYSPTEYQYSTVTPSYHEGWVPNGKVSNLFAVNSLRENVIPLYQFYRWNVNGPNAYSQYVLSTNPNFGNGTFTLVRTEGKVYPSAINSSVIPLYEFFNSSTFQYTYSTNRLEFGNGRYYSTGPDGFWLQKIVGYVPK